MAQPAEATAPTPDPLTPEEQRQTLAVLDRLRRWHTEILATRGGVPFPDAAQLLAELRAERDPERP